MPIPTTPVPRGTNQQPWLRDLTFTPDTPFASAGLGVLMNTGAVADPTAAAYRHLLAQAVIRGIENGNQPGDLFPVANPTDYGTGYFWCQTEITPSDLLVLRPYQVLYSSSAHTALASAAAAAGITSTLSIWTVHNVGPAPSSGRFLEYAAEFCGQVVVTNSANRINAATRYLPTGAQFCDVATVSIDKSISPGLRIKGSGTGGTGSGAGGALEIICDQQGGIGYIIQVSSLTPSSGVGWLRRSI